MASPPPIDTLGTTKPLAALSILKKGKQKGTFRSAVVRLQKERCHFPSYLHEGSNAHGVRRHNIK